MATQAEVYGAGLRELAECRWRVMGQLADLADDQGDHDTAAGWRWLATYRRWPHEVHGGGVEWYAAAAKEVVGVPDGEGGIDYDQTYVDEHWWRDEEEGQDIEPGVLANYVPAGVFVFLSEWMEKDRPGTPTEALTEALGAMARAVGQWLRAGRAAEKEPGPREQAEV